MTSNLSISTVYAQNLEERVKLEPLTEALKSLFSEFGSVIDVVAKKNVRARGQAFIVFDRAEDAQIAIRDLQGFELFGKSMMLSMARSRSDKTVKTKCTADEYAMHKRHRQAEKDKRRALDAADTHKTMSRGCTGNSDIRPVKSAKSAGVKSVGVASSTVIPDEYLPPNKILFLQNIPDDYDIERLTIVFGRFDGFREIRLVPGRRGIAFVEYDAEQGAIAAKENTAGMAIKDKVLKVTYQRQ